MPNSHDETEPGLDEIEGGKRINFRDYPSTGLVVLAAVVSGLGWLAYKWSGAKRAGRAPKTDTPSQPETAAGAPPATGPGDDPARRSGDPS